MGLFEKKLASAQRSQKSQKRSAAELQKTSLKIDLQGRQDRVGISPKLMNAITVEDVEMATPSIPGALVNAFQRARRSVATLIDARPRRWQITNQEQVTTKDGQFVIRESSGAPHSYKLANIANIYFEPLLSKKGQADMFLWLKTNRPGKLEQVYAGTLDVHSGLIKKIEGLQKELGLR